LGDSVGCQAGDQPFALKTMGFSWEVPVFLLDVFGDFGGQRNKSDGLLK